MKIKEIDFKHACESYSGYCTTCDDITNDSGVEPDAEKYQCDTCDELTVMGAENALLAGHITFI